MSGHSPVRDASLDLDMYLPDMAFQDHDGQDQQASVLDGILLGAQHTDASYQRFTRIASGQEMEDFDSFYDPSDEAEFSLSADNSIGSGAQSPVSAEAKAKQEEEWTRELAKTEEEIHTLRQVLSSKMKRMQDLKRKLGITVWKEFKEDMEQGIRNIQETAAYQKTSQTLKSASEKTSEAFGSLGASMSKKLDEVKQSPAFKNIEEKVGSAYSNVKTKVGGANETEDRGKDQPLIEAANGAPPAEKH